MEQDYTFNVLVKYLYRETDLFETLEIEDALAHDSSLAADFTLMKKAFIEMPKVGFFPSNATMNAILSQSQSTSLNTAY